MALFSLPEEVEYFNDLVLYYFVVKSTKSAVPVAEISGLCQKFIQFRPVIKLWSALAVKL